MNLNVDDQLSSVTRAVSYTERDGRPTSVVTLARSFPARVDNLWDAITSANRLPRWFMPVSGDLQPGGRFQLEGNAGGTIVTCLRRSRLGVTWEFAGDVSWVEVRFVREGAGRARFTLSHEALLSPHWDEFGPGAAGVGWEMGLLGLSLHLAQPDAPKIDEEEFAASPEGRALVVGSSDGWAQASIDAGDDPEAARAAAARTAAFYTSAG
ncbi:MAG: SRPBCC domain-containing protein [Chloroflexota bacterium]|nr:SRPBCC domain-containing protein [Chloroflexota bacterium]MDE2942196.1 SRPBCC domain-containing protein [Chloroflexota bacterium]MDE3267503.1 SRPBCC domain-containing protein [Chloroflexota bacterium]